MQLIVSCKPNQSLHLLIKPSIRQWYNQQIPFIAIHQIYSAFHFEHISSQLQIKMHSSYQQQTLKRKP